MPPVHIAALAALPLFAVAQAATAQDMAAPPVSPPPAGEYRADMSHASIIAYLDHMGFSRYPVRFTRFDIALDFDPDAPQAMSVAARIDPSSLETHYPGEDVDFDAELTGPQWLDTASHPQIRFVSTAVEMTGADTARVTGMLSLMGVDRPVTLDVRYNGGYAGMAPYDPQARVGFSATAQFDRSEFGLSYGLPPEGTNFGVGDTVSVIIEAELLGPALTTEAAGE